LIWEATKKTIGAVQVLGPMAWRPKFPEDMPVEYTRLAQWCWHPEPRERPTSVEVVNEVLALSKQHKKGKFKMVSSFVFSGRICTKIGRCYYYESFE
jgi:hypothetical protein